MDTRPAGGGPIGATGPQGPPGLLDCHPWEEWREPKITWYGGTPGRVEVESRWYRVCFTVFYSINIYVPADEMDPHIIGLEIEPPVLPVVRNHIFRGIWFEEYARSVIIPPSPSFADPFGSVSLDKNISFDFYRPHADPHLAFRLHGTGFYEVEA